LAIHAERWSANCGGELKFGLSLCPIHKVQELQKVSFFSAILAVMDSFVFQVDWATVAAVIGLLGSLVAVFVYGGRHH
jgi:O-antigen/teichoic acid export membrane protein